MVARRIAVIGAGWAGLAAALEAASAGASVRVVEMAPAPGGRARDAGPVGSGLDNGQHICIGAYEETLALLARIGVDASQAFLRLPLRLVDAHGVGLRLPAGPPRLSFARAVLGQRGWPWRDRLALLGAARRWQRQGFRCDERLTVAALCAALPETVRAGLIEPLCVAALNTSADLASGAVFLRVLGDALAAGRGASDLLLPRLGLSALLPVPALRALAGAGAEVRLARRVERIERASAGWRVEGEVFDAVVVAASVAEAARLVMPHDPVWSGRAEALRHEAIATVYATGDGARLPEPMLALAADATRPAQFVFDRGALGGPPGLLAFVVSGADAWVACGTAAIEQAVLAQAGSALGSLLPAPLRALRTIVEKRATFRCTPMLQRPAMAIAPGLLAAGDYVEGPYPATLEGAVRSGLQAARAALA